MYTSKNFLGHTTKIVIFGFALLLVAPSVLAAAGGGGGGGGSSGGGSSGGGGGSAPTGVSIATTIISDGNINVKANRLNITAPVVGDTFLVANGNINMQGGNFASFGATGTEGFFFSKEIIDIQGSGDIYGALVSESVSGGTTKITGASGVILTKELSLPAIWGVTNPVTDPPSETRSVTLKSWRRIR